LESASGFGLNGAPATIDIIGAVTHAPPPEYSLSDLASSLHTIFGFEEFRALQADAIRTATTERDVLVVMPTGAGKSLCYQLPAALAAGTTLVVSPLVALMRDQVLALQERTAFAELGCAFLNSSQNASEQRVVLDALRAGKLKLLYVAPERFRAGGFLETLQSIRLARLVVDEAHCISQWGHDFRPDYLALKGAVEALGNPPLTAVTATATKRVQSSIIANLGMRDPHIVIGGFDRPNLHFSAVRCKNDSERADKLTKALPKLAARGGSGLIYVATRKQCEAVADLANHALAPLGVRAASYHAGMDANARNEIQSAWLGGEVHVLVATNAFGMGIDKPDVRYVIHWVHPESPEAYYQEAGRAGRDGHKSRCVILHHFADKRLREFFIENDALTVEKIAGAHAAICSRKPTVSTEQSDNSDTSTSEMDPDVVAIPRSWWKLALDWNEVTARAVLGKLDHFGLIARLHETADNTVVRIVERSITPQLKREIENHLAQEIGERRARLDEMIAYCKAPRCRRRLLLEYFGDEREATPREFCCDYCDNPGKFERSRQSTALPDDVPATSTAGGDDIHTLLQNLDALRPRVGKDKLNKIMRASKSKEIERFENHALYGVFHGATRSAVTDFLFELQREGLMAQASEDEYFVWFVTEAGRHTWKEKAPLAIRLPFATPTCEALEDDEPGAELFEKLRHWRRKRADQENLPPYCVLSDKTLRAIAVLKPENEDALAQVPGIGAKKLEKYGEDVLLVVDAE
jgi:ATP-dependent DNA helicase RecQ